VTMKHPAEWIDLAGELGVFRVHPGGSAMLPTGTYELAKGTGYEPCLYYEKTKNDGTKWQLWGYPSEKASKVVVKAGKKTALPFGAPFASWVMYDGWGMKVNLHGQGGEPYSYQQRVLLHYYRFQAVSRSFLYSFQKGSHRLDLT